MQLKSVGKGGRRLFKSLLLRSKLVYLKAGWDQSGANMLDEGLEKNNRFKFDQISLIPAIVFIPSLDEVL